MQSSSRTWSNSSPLAEWMVVRWTLAPGCLGRGSQSLFQLFDPVEKGRDGRLPGAELLKHRRPQRPRRVVPRQGFREEVLAHPQLPLDHMEGVQRLLPPDHLDHPAEAGGLFPAHTAQQFPDRFPPVPVFREPRPFVPAPVEVQRGEGEKPFPGCTVLPPLVSLPSGPGRGSAPAGGRRG